MEPEKAEQMVVSVPIKGAVESVIRRRAEAIVGRCRRLLDLVCPINVSVSVLWLAGSSLSDPEKASDFDFFVGEDILLCLEGLERTDALQTDNAWSVDWEGRSYQFIEHSRHDARTLEELIESFDFSHVQAGAEIIRGKVSKVYVSDLFVSDRAAGTSTYRSEKTPISSLFRLMKYHRRGDIPTFDARRMIVQMVCAAIRHPPASVEEARRQLSGLDPTAEEQEGMGQLAEMLFAAYCESARDARQPPHDLPLSKYGEGWELA